MVDVNVKRRMDDYTTNVELKIGNYATSTINATDIDPDDLKSADIYDLIFEGDNADDDEFDPQELNKDGSPYIRPEAEEPENESPNNGKTDENIGRKVQLAHESGESMEATIKRRKTNESGDLIGIKHKNPLHDSREYEVEFNDGTTAEYRANIIAENLYSQIDDEGKQYTSMLGISDYKCDDDAISKDNGWLTLNGGARKRKITTKGWWLLIDWKDGSQSWISLREAKESHPIEVAEYAVANKLETDPAFA